MNLVVLLCLLPVGPPTELEKKDTITILVDTTHPDRDIKRRSIIATKEIKITDERFFPDITYHINHRYNVEIRERSYEQDFPSLPCFKLSKNDNWKSFCPGTFTASGTFIKSFYSYLRFIEYAKELEQWKEWRDDYKSAHPRVTKSISRYYQDVWDQNKETMMWERCVCLSRRQLWTRQPPIIPYEYPAGMLKHYYSDFYRNYIVEYTTYNAQTSKWESQEYHREECIFGSDWDYFSRDIKNSDIVFSLKQPPYKRIKGDGDSLSN